MIYSVKEIHASNLLNLSLLEILNQQSMSKIWDHQIQVQRALTMRKIFPEATKKYELLIYLLYYSFNFHLS